MSTALERNTEEDASTKRVIKQVSQMNKSRRFKNWFVYGAVALSVIVAMLMTASLTHVNRVKANSDHVFELLIYHTMPGKATALESIFRDDSKLMAQHGINVVGFWVPNEDPAWNDTFVYIVDFPSRDEAKKRWQDLLSDPASKQYVEAAKPILEKINGEYRVDEIYMRPTDFSTMR